MVRQWGVGLLGKRVVGAAMAGFIFLAGCQGCPTTPVADGGVDHPKVSFFSPVNGATLTTADDVDLDTAGIQIAVEVRGDDRVQDGTTVTVTVDTQAGRSFAGTISNQAARVVVNLAAGIFPAGQANVLTVSAGSGMEGDTITVHAIENTPGSCVFLRPARNSTLTQDSNAAAPGFQTDVEVQCTGTTVAPGGPARLQVFQGTTATGTPILTTSVSLANGRAVFEGVTLPQGDITLQATAAAVAGGQVGLAVMTVRVDTGGCDARITAPAVQSVLTSLNSTDLDPTSEPLDLNFTILSALCPNGTVDVQVDSGASVFSGPMTGGTATVRVALPQGSSRVVAQVRPADGVRTSGQSIPVNYTVDTLAPCPVLTSPAGGAVLAAGDDEEVPPNAANGVTYTLKGTVSHPEGATSVNVAVLAGAQSIIQQDVGINMGTFALKVPNMGAQGYLVRLTSVDTNGNKCPATGAAAIESRFSVDLAASGVTFSLANDTQPQDGTINLLEDASADQGIQARVHVTLSGADATTATARVRFTPVDAAGNTSGQPVDVEAALLADGTVDVTATLVDGRYRLSVVVAFGDGRPSISPAGSQTIVVDSVAPVVTIQSPAANAQLATATVDLRASIPDTTVDAAAVSLDVNGMTSGVTAVPGMGGVYDFVGIMLTGAMDGTYVLTVSAKDAAGNIGSAAVTVHVDDIAPKALVRGVGRDAVRQDLEPLAAMGTQARTQLDISSAAGLMALDFNQDASDGLQYAFEVEVPLADCMGLGSTPTAVLSITGQADDVAVPLTNQGGACKGLADNGGTGFTLQDGDGQVTVNVQDTAGNRGSYAFFYKVLRQTNLVRIDAPANGARVGLGTITVLATTDLASGTCELRVNGMALGAPQPASAAMAFPAVSIPGLDGDAATLVVVCSAANPVSSLSVIVVKDALPPTGGALVLANGDALPGAFNRQTPPDGMLGNPRFLKDLAVEVDAEASTCSRLATVTFQATAGMPVEYMPAAWTLLPGTPGRCRATVSGVDLGAANDVGTTTTLQATVVDTAGNSVTLGPVDVLNDQVAPVMVRTAPTKQLFNALDDMDSGTPGFQVVFSYTVSSPDGRVGQATIGCTGTSPACTSTPVAVPAAAFQFGDVPGEAVTLAGAGLDGTAQVTVRLADAAGNEVVDVLDVSVDVTPAVLEVLSPANDAFITSANGVPMGNQVQITTTVRVTNGVDATGVDFTINGGAPVVLCTLAGGVCTGRPLLPQGNVRLTYSVVDIAGNTTTTVRDLQVDSVGPSMDSLVIAQDANLDHVGNAAEDASPNPKFQSAVTVQLTGLETGRLVTLLTNLPQMDTVLAGPVAVSAAGAAVFPVVNFVEGAHLLRVRASDAAANALDEATTETAFAVDITAPAVTIQAPALPMLLVATDADGNGTTAGWLGDVTLATDAPAGSSCVLLDSNPGSTVPAAQTVSGTMVQFTGVRLGEGVRNLVAICTDAAGNTGTSAPYAGTVDTLGPVISMVTPSMGVFGQANDADLLTPGIQVSFTILHSNVDAGQAFAFVSSVEGVLSTGANAAQAGGSTVVVVTFTQEGQHQLTLGVQDNSGNTGMAGPYTMDIQTGLWNVAILSPSGNPVALGVAQDQDSMAAGLQLAVTFETTAPAGTTATLVLDGNSATVAAVNTVDLGGGKSGATFHPTLAEGSHTFSVHVDSGAKVGDSPMVDAFVDLGAPVITITTPSTILAYNVAGDATHVADLNPVNPLLQASIVANVTGCGTVANPGLLQVRFDGVDRLPMARQVTADGVVTLASVDLPNGDAKALVVVCTDAGGNSGQASKTVTVDWIAPKANVVSALLDNTADITADSKSRRKGKVNISFMAPGDDSNVTRLQPGSYAMAYRVGAPLDASNFASSTALMGVPATPGVPDTTESFSVQGFKMEQKVYIGIKTVDDAGNVTVVSSAEVDFSLKKVGDINGAANTFYGLDMNRVAGDVNGDGFEDVLVGASGASPAGATGAGELTVYFGAADGTLTPAGKLYIATASLGCTASSVFLIPDLNKDGKDEFGFACSAAHLRFYLWYGKATAWVDGTAPDLVITATNLPGSGFRFGRSVTSLDFDGDGNRDLVITARFTSGSTSAPRAWILHGDGTTLLAPIATPLDLRTTVVRPVTEILGPVGSVFGSAVVGSRLKATDTADALLVGAEAEANGANASAGSLYVIAGRTGTQGSRDATALNVGTMSGVTKLQGGGATWAMGGYIAAGDFDGDGDQDFLVGTNSDNAGGTRLFENNAGVVQQTAAGLRTLGIPGNANATAIMSPTQLVAVRDFNGDGLADIMLSADDEAHIYLGAAQTWAVLRQDPDFRFSLNTASPTRVTVGAADINGDGFGDVVIGSADSPGTVRVLF